MTILVTGGAGFIGSNFILNWLKRNDELTVNLDKLTYASNLTNLSAVQFDLRYLFIKADISDSELIRKLLDQFQVRAIIHFAAESHVDRSIENPNAFIETNILGTFNLLEATRAYWNNLNKTFKDDFRFLHISTDEVYGSLESDEPAFTEMHPYKPNSPYSASKASSNHLVRSYYHTYGLPVLTTNCSNNYGPYQYPEKLIPFFVKNALLKKSLPVYGDGLQIRDWLYVVDHCEAIECVLEKGKIGETYNIGGLNEKRNIDVVNTICSLLDDLVPRQDGQSYACQITHVVDRLGHDKRYAIDASKINRELHWKPKETFESGFKKTVEWYVSQ